MLSWFCLKPNSSLRPPLDLVLSVQAALSHDPVRSAPPASQVDLRTFIPEALPLSAVSSSLSFPFQPPGPLPPIHTLVFLLQEVFLPCSGSRSTVSCTFV